MNIRKQIWIILFVPILTSCIQDWAINFDNTPQGNFGLLWKTADENYCFFEEKKINWDSIKDVYEPMISENMSDEELFSVCGAMLNELKDGHVNLYSDFNTSRYWDWFQDYPQNFNWSVVERNYLGKDCLIAGSLKAQLIRDIGYLRFESFDNTISYANVKEVLAQMGEIKGLIIDIRDNGGGYIDMAKAFASCFFSEKKLVAYEKHKEGPGHSEFSVYLPQYLNPDSSVIYTGRIFILTNRLVFSSANYFVAMMKTLPNVTVIGDVTGGGGGLPFSSELYNGWELRISRNPIFNVDKESIEEGINPDFYVDMDSEEESDGIDSIIEYAIDQISN